MPFGWFKGASTLPASSQQVDTSPTAKNPLNPEGIKPCCACPLTKQKRDDCFMNSMNGEVECGDLIQAHKECMAGFGFKV